MATALVPPGPKGHLVTGHLEEFSRDPLGMMTHCAREYGDVVRLRFLHIPVYLVNSPDLIESVLVRQSSNFIKSVDLRAAKEFLGNGLLTSEGEFWRRQRRLAQPAFHRERIAAYAEIMTAYAQRMLAGWREGEARDLHKDMMRLTLEIAAKTLFDSDVGREAQDVGAALEAMLKRFDSLSSSGFLLLAFLPTPTNLRAKRAVRRLDEIIYDLIQRRRAKPGNQRDLLSMLLAAQDENGSGMTDRQLRDETLTLLLAGHETTAVTLSWTWYLLAEHPEVEAKLVSELKETLGGRAPTIADLPRLTFTQKVVTESMRLYPPAWGIGREAISDCELGDYHMAAGTNVYILQWIVQRDPRYYVDPERFYPDRWTAEFSRSLPAFAYFPFGGGPRVCIGASFATTEAALLLATIAQQFHLDLQPGHTVEPWPSITLRPRNGIHVVPRRR